MAKIVYLMGKSSSGKDTIYKRLLEDRKLGLKTVVPYTTRPIRDGETDGVEYFFLDEDGFQKLKQDGKVIEDREYYTYHGLWRYFTVDDGQLDEGGAHCIMIGTLESYAKMRSYFGDDKIIPIMIELDDGIRLQRALNRELQQDVPKYEEMCRRFLADSEDFAEEKIVAAGLTKRFQNNDLQECLQEIKDFIAPKIV
jgi:guanylate kinase